LGVRAEVAVSSSPDLDDRDRLVLYTLSMLARYKPQRWANMRDAGVG
jgi:hypothetical protein